MQRLINDLLTFSRAIKSDQPFVPVDLNEATKEVLTDLEIRVEQTQAAVEVDPLPTIDARRHKYGNTAKSHWECSQIPTTQLKADREDYR